MFRVLVKAKTGHGYDVIECFLSGKKRGMFKTVNIKISDTSLRAKQDQICEQKMCGEWIPCSLEETKSLIDEFNEVRKARDWDSVHFERYEPLSE